VCLVSAENPCVGGSTPPLTTYANLIQAKKLADAMGGVDKARAALDVLVKLL